MYEFDKFVYLDVQKTGSSFIAALLRKHCRGKESYREQHKGLADSYDPSKFYFISVRDPLDQYISLYSYGCQGVGKLYINLNRSGYGNYYDGTWGGFRSWLRVVLDPEHSEMLDPAYAASAEGRLCQLIGLQSYRVLSLSIPNVDEVLAQCADREAIRSQYNAKNIVQYVVRYENFRTDLVELLKTKLRDEIPDLEGALQFAETADPIRASQRVDRYETHPRLGGKLRRTLRDREWFMYEDIGYGKLLTPGAVAPEQEAGAGSGEVAGA